MHSRGEDDGITIPFYHPDKGFLLQVLPNSADCVAGCVQRWCHDCPVQGPRGGQSNTQHLELEGHLHFRHCVWPVPHHLLLGFVLHSCQNSGSFNLLKDVSQWHCRCPGLCSATSINLPAVHVHLMAAALVR